LCIGIQHSPLFQLLSLLCITEELLNLLLAGVRRVSWSKKSSRWMSWGGRGCVKSGMVEYTTVDTIRELTRLTSERKRERGVKRIRKDIVAMLGGTSQHASLLNLILNKSIFFELTVLLVGITVLELLSAASDDGVMDWDRTVAQRTDHHIVINFVRVDFGTNVTANTFLTKPMTTLQCV
jgi:hypothetical protein